MVEVQLRRRGISDERVLAAMGEVPRELFVPDSQREVAYTDAALSIGSAQTVSQPWIVAAVCQALALRGDETVLEIGGGSGYSAAVLARLVRRVISVERIAELADRARSALAVEGIGPDRVQIVVGDGSIGLHDAAPFPAIAVHAAVPRPPRTLLSELAPGGRLVAPVGTGRREMLTLFVRDDSADGGLDVQPIAPCRFVPLLGAEGFPER